MKKNPREEKSNIKETRKKYWNENYYKYWKERVKEANQNVFARSNIIKGDSLTASDKNYFSALELLDIKKDSLVLEIGCGFGRSISFLYGKTRKIYAIDISEAMVNAAKRKCGRYKGVKFKISEAEKTPFKPNFFDNLICFGVFDALYQKETLLEMNRILKKGGRVLITGKNDNYFSDDKQALIAEKNARQKGHPNYFTDLKKLFEHLEDFGFSLVHKRFFLRRGDMNKECFVTRMPNFFYAYMLVLEKFKHISRDAGLEISSMFSKTFHAVERKTNG